MEKIKKTRTAYRLGEIHKTNNCGNTKIIEYFNSINCTIQFEDGTILKNIEYSKIISSHNPNTLSVFNIGYIGEGKYTSKNTKAYNPWYNMFNRCYNEKYQDKHPTYKGCLVNEYWYNFQNFAQWFEENYVEGWHLDKDILQKGNKIYSPETCCFVPQEINKLFTKRNRSRGKHLIGVTYNKKNKNFTAQISKGANTSGHIGSFIVEIEAFCAYKIVKEKEIKKVADKWKDKISKKVYKALINYKVEITD